MATIVSNPIVNITKSSKAVPLENSPQRVLIVGQMTSTGSATSGSLYQEIDNAGQEDTLFGANSHIAGMIRQFKRINKYSRVDAIALDDAAGTKGTATIAFTGGPATADGTIIVTVGSRENHQYEVDVVTGDTVTDIGDALEALINADTDANFTATNTTGSVEIECDNAGTLSNSYGIEYIGDIEGVTTTLTGWAGGATDPALTTLFDPITNMRYQTIVYPSNWDVDEVTDLLEPRWNYENKILDGVAIVTYTDSVADLKVLGNAENSKNLVIFGNEETSTSSYKAGSLFEMNDIVSAEFAAIRALRLTDDTDLSLYSVGVTQARDLRGGSHMASKPYHETPMYNLPLCDEEKGFTDTEISELKDAGISVIGNNKASTGVVLGTVVTTYKTDGGGNVDGTYKYLNYVDTFSNIAEYIFNNFKRDYAQYRITKGNVIAGHNIANEKTIRGAFITYYAILSGEDYVLTQAGPDAVKYFSENLTVDLDLEEGKVTAVADVPIVTQLRQLDAILYAVFDY